MVREVRGGPILPHGQHSTKVGRHSKDERTKAATNSTGILKATSWVSGKVASNITYRVTGQPSGNWANNSMLFGMPQGWFTPTYLGSYLHVGPVELPQTGVTEMDIDLVEVQHQGCRSKWRRRAPLNRQGGNLPRLLGPSSLQLQVQTPTARRMRIRRRLAQQHRQPG